MLKNYFKIAWRSLIKRKFYSLLNISGLALGMACCLLIYLYISYHLSFDTYHKKADTTFRLVYEIYFEKTQHDKGASVAMFEALKTEVPQVDDAALSISNQSFIIDVNGSGKYRFKEEKNISFAGSDWFRLFHYNWLEGNPEELDEPNTVALTEKQSRKYFGRSSAMGQILAINGIHLKVIGILGDKPLNTHLKSDMYISLSSFKTLNPKADRDYFTNWTYQMTSNNVYVSLRDASQKDVVEKELGLLAKKHIGDIAQYYHFTLLPLKETHFDLRYGGSIQKSLLAALGIIAVLIIVIAGINYINMMIAQQTRRSIEIGTRKVLGGSSKQLFMQFMTESLLTSALVVITAIFLVLLLLPLTNRLLFADEPIYIISYLKLGLFLMSMLLLITLGTGIYPAIFLSRIHVFRALKNNMLNLSAGIGRKGLVVFQNIIAQALIVCTIIIALQVQFVKNTDKGFDRDLVVMIPVHSGSDLQKEQLGRALRAMPGVGSFSFCQRAPSSSSFDGATIQFNKGGWEKWPAIFAVGDFAYVKTFGMQIIAGRNARPNTPRPEFLINETMVSMLHTQKSEDVVGKNLVVGDAKGDIHGSIVGVLKDFNVGSLLMPIAPSIVLERRELHSTLALKLSGKNTSATLTEIQKQYMKIFPDQVFSYQFFDEQIVALYKTESLQQKLIWLASIIAILISSLGLLGLISLITLQRTKEIGIRKVLGASVARIGFMLSKDFVVLVLFALVIASALSWWAMHQWLQNFPYRIEIQWWMFALAGSVAIAIALLTISFQAVKAALANPVKSLRTE